MNPQFKCHPKTIVAALLTGIFVLFILFGQHQSARAGGVLYAASDGDGDCSSWAEACSLHEALSDAVSGDQIWVLAGVHVPGAAREDSFTLITDSVEIYGGFAGTETALEQRDWQANPTILSGDIDDDDLNEDGNFIAETTADIVGGNSYRVVVTNGLDTGAIMDGLIITAGYADGVEPDIRGGGMDNEHSSLTLNHMIFSGNYAVHSGGGMSNFESSPILTNVLFSGNWSSDGGGMNNYSSSSPVLTDVIFRYNEADYGGGMNSSSDSDASLTNVAFIANEAVWGGGGMRNSKSDPTLINVLFSNNVSGDYGGGMSNYTSSPRLVNVTFANNSAVSIGGGIANRVSSAPVLSNAILWGNTASSNPQIDSGDSTTTITYSDIQGGYPGDGNIDADPLFVNPASGDLRLQPNSPAVDAGNNAEVLADVTTDLNGSPRFVDVPSNPDSGSGASPVVDMGAYETHFASGILYVDPDAPGPAQDGDSWSTAFLELQDALVAANPGNQVWVAEGMYTPGPAGDRQAAFPLMSGVAIYGGFAGGETTLDQRDWVENVTILSGDIDGNDANTDGNFIAETTADIQGSNCYHVVRGSGADATAVLDGFTITAGSANGEYPDNRGAGMAATDSSPILNNLTFTGSFALEGGGGIYSLNGSPTLTNIVLKNNLAGNYGGGAYNYHSSPIYINVIFMGNQSGYGGGMANTNTSVPVLTNVTLYKNTASQNGGALYNFNSSSPVVVNAILWGNKADVGQQVFNSSNSIPTITYSDIQDGYTGDGNINADPLFVDPTSGDLCLQPGSPAIDAGNNAAVPDGIVKDLDNRDRFVDIADVEDTGSGAAPVVDMGAYEAQIAVNMIYLPSVVK